MFSSILFFLLNYKINTKITANS